MLMVLQLETRVKKTCGEQLQGKHGTACSRHASPRGLPVTCGSTILGRWDAIWV